MAKFRSTYPGTLILPNGDEVAPGAEVDLGKEAMENAGVKEWLDAGWLVKPTAPGKAET